MPEWRHYITIAGSSLLTAMLLSVPASAGNVNVIEGDIAEFRVTVQPKSPDRGTGAGTSIRVWYDTDGGTATEGADYATAHSWSHHVRGTVGEPLLIQVETFADNAVEGEETFTIRVRKLQVLTQHRWGQVNWRTVPNFNWTSQGATTATIKDATIPQGSYEKQKYGSNYSGTVWGE